MRPVIIVSGMIAALVILMLFSGIGIPSTRSSISSLPDIGKAPELAGITGWINTQPLTLAGLRGKVILIDFWTYSCINCIRTLPYLESWQQKYAGMGLVIIGVHTPEFEFEKDYSNVKAAAERFGVKYPVALDNDYATWQAYSNRYWPREFLIDGNGRIRHDHIGEGGYEETEMAIQSLLKEINMSAPLPASDINASYELSRIGTQEIYLGYNFARQPLGNAEGFSPGNVVDYKPVTLSQPNAVYLSGQWLNSPDSIVSANGSGLSLKYTAKDVNVVAGGSATIEVLLDGKPLPSDYAGQDVSAGNGTATASVNGQRLYNIVSGPGYGQHIVEIKASPGLGLYTFTFG